MIASSSTFCPHPGRVIRDLFRQLNAVYIICMDSCESSSLYSSYFCKKSIFEPDDWVRMCREVSKNKALMSCAAKNILLLG